MIKVLIVDDQDLVRFGMKKILESVKGINVVGEASSGEEVLKNAREIQPDVILMDVKMHGIGGMEATRKLGQMLPKIKVLALSSCIDDPFPSRMLKAGAVGYITKGSDATEMIHAIREVHAGRRYVTPEVAQQLALKHLTDDKNTPFDDLSDRELQVALMIADGVKVPDIAKRLHLSPKTVNSYRYRIFQKLRISTNVELVQLCMRYSLLED